MKAIWENEPDTSPPVPAPVDAAGSRSRLTVMAARLDFEKAKLATGHFIFFMNVQEQIKKYIASQPESKYSDMQELHRIILDNNASM